MVLSMLYYIWLYLQFRIVVWSYKHVFERLPVLICHIENELGIVDVEVSVEVANKSPIQTIPSGVFFECVELVANLLVDVFALAVAFAALRFDNPDAYVMYADGNMMRSSAIRMTASSPARSSRIFPKTLSVLFAE